MSMESPSTDSTSTAPSGPSARSYSPSATRYLLPCACQSDDVIGDLPGRSIRGDHSDARDAAHPLALIRRVPTRAHDERGDRLVARQRRDLLEPECLPRGQRDRPLERAANFFLDAGVEHRARPLLDPPFEHVLLEIEADDDGRVTSR